MTMNNSTQKRWLTVTIIALLLANTLTLVLLWGRGNGKENHQDRNPKGQVFEYMTKELALDKNQQDAYAQLRNEHQAGMRAVRDSMHTVKDAFFGLLKDPAASDSLINYYSKKAGELEQRIDLVTYRHFQKVRGICTAVQQEKFDRIIREVLHRLAQPRQGPPGKDGQAPPIYPPPSENN